VPLLRNAVSRGIMAADTSDVTFAGEPAKAFYAPQFKKPKTGRGLLNMEKYPRLLVKFMDRHVRTRPVVKKGLCTGCAECVRSCPAKVIGMDGKLAVISYGKCIRCYCCQELCPKKAMKIYKPVLSRVFSVIFLGLFSKIYPFKN